MQGLSTLTEMIQVNSIIMLQLNMLKLFGILIQKIK